MLPLNEITVMNWKNHEPGAPRPWHPETEAEILLIDPRDLPLWCGPWRQHWHVLQIWPANESNLNRRMYEAFIRCPTCSFVRLDTAHVAMVDRKPSGETVYEGRVKPL